MMTPQQSHKLHILFLMLTSDSIKNIDIENNLNTIQELVKDVPTAIDALNTWKKGDNATYNTDRTAARTAATDFLATDGNGWGGGGSCPHDIGAMLNWLQAV